MKLSRGSGDPVGTGRILEKLTCALWFVLKCRSTPAVILRPFRNGSEPQPSQPIVYVRFDRADDIEPLLASVKCVYYVDIDIGESVSWQTAAMLPASSSETTHAHRPGRFKPPGRFITSWFVCIGPELSSRCWSVAYACAVSRFRPASVWLWGPACGPIDRSRRVKISVKSV